MLLKEFLRENSRIIKLKDETEEILNLKTGSAKNIELICVKENHSFISQPRKFTKSKEICDYCSNRKLLVGFNDFKSCYPEIAKEYDNLKNEKTSENIIKTSTVLAYWNCKTCKTDWDKMSVNQRIRQKQNCPYCANKRLKIGLNDLASRHPELISQWSTKNKEKISEVLGGSEKYYWNCKNNHELYSNYYKRLKYGCGICSGNIFIPGINDWITKTKKDGRKDLLAQWDYNKNIGVDPNLIKYSSNEKAWWSCSKKHKWKASICSRVNRNCPICSNQRLAEGYNDLQTFCENNKNFKHLIKEWHKDNLPMNTFTKRAGKKAKWCCSYNHEWEALISNRTAGDGCPLCKESQGEKDLKKFIKTITKTKLIKNDRSVLKGKELDLYLPELKIAIEYNGNYWHSSKFKNNPFEYHLEKREDCEDQNIKLVFVWEDDWKNNQNFIKECLIKFLNKGDINPILNILSKD